MTCANNHQGPASNTVPPCQVGRRPKVWELIEKWEEAGWRLSEAEDHASSVTRWWLLVPIIALGIPTFGLILAPIVVHASPTEVDIEAYVVLLAFGLPLFALLTGVEVWLFRKMVAPRRINRQHRREMKQQMKKVKQQLRQERRYESPVAAPGTPRQRARTELIAELGRIRRQKVHVGEQGIMHYKWSYCVLGIALVAPIALVAVFGIAMPLASGSFHALIPVSVLLLGFLIWACTQAFKKFGASELLRRPRKHELTYITRWLEREIRQVYGEEALLRQPTGYASMMWRRFPFLGRSPEVALNELPRGVNRIRLWFHRYLGWGTTAAIGIAVILLVIYSFVQ